MAKLIVESVEDFKERTEAADFRICQHIYPAIKRGVEKNRKSVKVFDLILKGDPMHEYSFTLDRNQWRRALTTCLEAYAKQELYEDCSIMQKLIATLPE